METQPIEKTKKMKRIRFPQSFSTDDYQKGWLFYQQFPSVSALAKHIGVSKTVADRMVHRGYPDVGLEPYKTRLLRLRARESEKVDDSLAKSRAKLIKSVDLVATFAQFHLTKYVREIQSAGGNIEILDPKLDRLKSKEASKLLLESVNLKQSLLRDEPNKNNDDDLQTAMVAIDLVNKMNEEEMLVFIQSHQLPNRMISGRDDCSDTFQTPPSSF